ncbi:hypothetical protein LOAG_17218 [Loa loa]|uniref:Uncharacterized protein n=1 Tax=Loa loa TaxID=7209 RepID=A0A1S0UJI6_LOALO|nr:hypothetical protein LOAG_17218 [Loa loa]EJD75693.1 hypothetical protein LOAG_17218 [Loa loa]
MPYTLRRRERHSDFLVDPPLTNISAHFAAEIGCTMTQNLPIVVYSGPEMAVLQTARQFIGGAQIDMNWLIEPGLVRYFSSHESRPSNCQSSNKKAYLTKSVIVNQVLVTFPAKKVQNMKETVTKV